MEFAVVLLAILALVIVVLVIGRAIVTVAIVHDYERGLRFRGGRLVGLTGSGTHVAIRPLSEVRVLDVRPVTLAVEGQEVPTADGVAVKVSLVARYEIGDPVAAFTRDASYVRTLYVLLQLALRDVLVTRTLDEALVARAALGGEVREATAGRLAELGIELLDVHIRDLMLPADLKRAFGAVVGARKAGEAALERARAETAALRGLANAGRMLDDNPGLLQLRILQEVGGSSGNSIVFGTPDGLRPAPGQRRAPAAGAKPHDVDRVGGSPPDPGAGR